MLRRWWCSRGARASPFLHTQHRTQYKWLPSPSLPPSWLAPARSLAARSPPRPPTAPARPPCAPPGCPAPSPPLPRRLPPLVRTSRRGDDATRHARGGRSKNPPGRAFRRSRPAIAPSRTRETRRDERGWERSPTVSGGVRRLFSPPPRAFPTPRPSRAIQDTRLTLSNPSHPSPSLFFPQRLRLRSPRSR